MASRLMHNGDGLGVREVSAAEFARGVIMKMQKVVFTRQQPQTGSSWFLGRSSILFHLKHISVMENMEKMLQL